MRIVPNAQSQASAIEATLTLVSNLCLPMTDTPGDSILTFQVENPSDIPLRVGVVVDNFSFYVTDSLQVELEGLENGYHLLRAFLLLPDGEVLKRRSAYVEAEFIVGEQVTQVEKYFYFGQPSLCFLSPWAVRADLSECGERRVGSSLFCDFFVNNVQLGQEDFSVVVYVDGSKVGEVHTWESFYIEGAPKAPYAVKLVLKDPIGGEIHFPTYNACQRDVRAVPLKVQKGEEEGSFRVEDKASTKEEEKKAGA